MSAQNNIPTIDVEVFPDSGHHFLFVPLSSKHLAITKLKKACLQDKLPWEQLPTHPWLRYRPGRQDNEAGVHVAIESNLGSIRRGTIYEPRAGVALETPPEIGAQSAPYAYEGIMKIPVDQDAEEVLLTIANPDNFAEQMVIARLQVIWKEPAGEARNVDLVVDFGNTRTTVLALENIKAKDGKLNSICRPIYFVNRGTDYQDTDDHKGGSDAIIDSWFVLHETAFSQMDPPSGGFQPTCEYDVEEEVTKTMMGRTKTEESYFATKRVPQMFVQLSPTIMGNQARDILAGIDLESGGSFSLSSPKRYIWDDSRMGQGGEGTSWMMRYNRWNPEARSKRRLPALQGPLCRYLYADGRAWEDIDDAPHEKENISDRPHLRPEKSDYPRKDTVTWSALAILETAYRQITSEEFRKGNDPYLPRKLANVHVTYPAGWIQEEIDLYRKAWRKAINIWTVSNKENRALVSDGGDRPGLEVNLDEAVASQLPLVYSEVIKLRNIGENWIELYGRGEGDDARVRLMTIDIGGGTMDISIVEYRDEQEGAGVLLVYNTLFKDCNSFAGDKLVDRVIGKVLLPAIGKRFRDDDDKRENFADVFSGRADAKAADSEKWSRIIKLVFLPIVRQWLSDLTNGTRGNPEENGRPWKPNEIVGPEGPLVDLGAVSEFNKFLSKEGFGEELFQTEERLDYDRQALEECVGETFRDGLSPLGKYVTAFEVDLVSLSGKPSELPQVKQLLDELLPLLPERIIRLKDYEAGSWYPMGKAGAITDAKTVTAVGAALYRAIIQGNIPNWEIAEDPDRSAQLQFNTNAWGRCPAKGDYGFGGKGGLPFLDRNESQSKPVKMLLNGYIGRMKFNSSQTVPEQQYQLVWRNPEEHEKKFPGNPQVEVAFERCEPGEDGNDTGIKLLDGSVLVKGEEMPSNVLELKLCTLEGGSFWMESAEFDVEWED